MQLSNPKLFREQAFVAGKWTDSDNGATFKVTNPATGEVLANVANCGAAETRRAIEAANEAWPAWRAKTAKERAQILRRLFDLIMANQRDLAMIMTMEQGKPLQESMGEVVYGASFFEWFGEEAKRVYGDTIPAHRADSRIVTVKEPIGVTAGITPWNFPLAMITRKASPALAAGCPMVIKPAEATPLTALALCVLGEEAGIPAGVLSVVTGDKAADIGGEMTGNPIVRKIGFTGSTPVGKLLMKQASDTVKKVSLELGGNAPFIVFDDADIESALPGAIACKFRNAGQTCVCANRILVQDGIYDKFVDRLKAEVAKMKVGNGMEDGVTIGPLIDERAIAKVTELVGGAKSAGAKPTVGGDPHELGGNFYSPTVLENVTTDMDILNNEIFGPVAPIVRFKDEADAIRIANDTPFGLAAYFYARDIGRVWRVSEGLEYGMVGINTGILSTEVAPFGGVKESGIGREGSKYGIEEWMEIKYLCMGDI
ncbi:NAD-dependent succinate-semialdehyde dehydrogenase [Marivibrio halodurans]|uniref:NAD-dependent succinate-semialdehyde dehydrogenase n=1 Tax=Marivibrio halodurans TaxID=2039722 RepID=A0A8J7V459_9PROT|nr:NAD-dependent succinate-semialdehyde dehydrogenase [Marivibrio halodurans]MBP5857329.1 NAD-dependent succinate-semialdehyde dehydrogenase [Marivibrio halodurans]